MKQYQSRLSLRLTRLVFAILSFGALFGTGIAAAQAAGVISVEIGKAKLIKLSVAPNVVMLGNPTVAEVVIEGNGSLFLLGLEPGETNMLILNDDGDVVLSSAVVVGPVQERQVTVDRGPETFTLSCNPRCVPVATPQGTGATTAVAAAQAQAAPGAGQADADAGAELANALNNLLGNQPAEEE